MDESVSLIEAAVRLTFSRYQKFVVAVLAFLQFTIVLDFMLMAPLGALVSPLWVLAAVIVALQIGIFSRMISASALMSALPKPSDRGAYMSVSASLQQVSGGVAAVVAGLIVVQAPGGDVLHFDTLGYLLVCTTLISLTLMYVIDRTIRYQQVVAP